MFPENVRGEETTVLDTTPDAFVERSALGTPVRPRVVVVAFVAKVLVKVCVPAQVLDVVVPNARESVGVCPPVERSGYVAVRLVRPVLVMTPVADT